MVNIAPVLFIRGSVRQVRERDVAPVAALPERTDPETGRHFAAREARPGYTCHDVILDTNPGGMVAVTITPGAAEATGGWLPQIGDDLELPVRGYTAWNGREGARYATNGYSLAGDLYAETLKAGAEGRRVSAVS